MINTQSDQTTAGIEKLIESLVISQGGYLADSLYGLTVTDDKQLSFKAVQNIDTAKFRWLIIGREHYFETSKEYPIANKRDLTKALAFEDNKAPFQGVTL